MQLLCEHDITDRSFDFVMIPHVRFVTDISQIIHYNRGIPRAIDCHWCVEPKSTHFFGAGSHAWRHNIRVDDSGSASHFIHFSPKYSRSIIVLYTMKWRKSALPYPSSYSMWSSHALLSRSNPFSISNTHSLIGWKKMEITQHHDLIPWCWWRCYRSDIPGINGIDCPQIWYSSPLQSIS